MVLLIRKDELEHVYSRETFSIVVRVLFQLKQ